LENIICIIQFIYALLNNEEIAVWVYHSLLLEVPIFMLFSTIFSHNITIT